MWVCIDQHIQLVTLEGIWYISFKCTSLETKYRHTYHQYSEVYLEKTYSILLPSLVPLSHHHPSLSLHPLSFPLPTHPLSIIIIALMGGRELTDGVWQPGITPCTFLHHSPHRVTWLPAMPLVMKTGRVISAEGIVSSHETQPTTRLACSNGHECYRLGNDCKTVQTVS